MAVLPLQPSITAQILIDGEPATEYPDQDAIETIHESHEVATHQNECTVSTYIESVSDAAFTLKFTIGPPFGRKNMPDSKIGFHVSIDGNPSGIVYCKRTDFKNNDRLVTWVGTLEGLKLEVPGRKRFEERQFIFAKVETKSDMTTLAKVQRMAERMKKVGMIEIQVHRQMYGKKGGPVETSTKNILKRKERESIPEKSVKGKNVRSDCTTLGDPQKVWKGDVWRSRKKEGEDFPLGIFRFMYRSEEALRQTGVLDRLRTPSPTPEREPTPDPDDVIGEDGLTPRLRREFEEEMRLRLEQAKAEAAAAEKSRKGPTEEDIRIKKEVADEEREQARKRAKDNAGKPRVVVDLCSDDEDEGEDNGSVSKARSPSNTTKEANAADKAIPSIERGRMSSAMLVAMARARAVKKQARVESVDESDEEALEDNREEIVY